MIHLQGLHPQIVQTRNQIPRLIHLTTLVRIRALHVRFPENAAGNDRSGVVHLQFAQRLRIAVEDQGTENSAVD